MMLNSGKRFEQSFRNSVDKNKIYYLRLKDSPAVFGRDSSKVRFTANNPYDNFCFFEQTLFPLELKSTVGTSFSFPNLEEVNNYKAKKCKLKPTMIKLNQIEGLLEASKYPNIQAGFLFNFEGEGKPTIWMNIKNFIQFYKSTTKKSINLQDMQQYGCIIVEKHKKKTNYSYNVEQMLLDIKEENY